MKLKLVVTLNKPIYAGFNVLELSKWLMYDFNYNFIKMNFDAELLFTDTDSLCYEFKCNDIYEEFFKWKSCLTLVVIQGIQSFFVKKIKKSLEKWKKDVFGGKVVKEFVGLKQKMRSMKLIDNHEWKRAKGVSISLGFGEFKDVLFNKITVRHKMRGIQAKKHEIGTYEIEKNIFIVFWW